MASKTAFFNKFLYANPDYVPVKDYNNVIKHIIVLKPQYTHIKIKFAKYKLMEPAHFYKAQRLYFVLYKFVQRCKAKYITVFDHNFDLCGNPLQNPLTLIENKTAYKFSIRDLQKVVLRSLTNQKHLFPEPIYPRNPYTNLAFSKHNLLIIYASSREVCSLELFKLFYNSDFNINAFYANNRQTLIEYAINEIECNESTIDDIYYLCSSNNIRVNEDFPYELLFSIFRPYLKIFYKAHYRISGLLSQMLKLFELYNPYFGMKYVDYKGGMAGSEGSGAVHFDSRHLGFNYVADACKEPSSDSAKGTSFHNLNHAYANKYKNNELCITLKPIEGAKYIIEDDDEEYDDEEAEELSD